MNVLFNAVEKISSNYIEPTEEELVDTAAQDQVDTAASMEGAASNILTSPTGIPKDKERGGNVDGYTRRRQLGGSLASRELLA